MGVNLNSILAFSLIVSLSLQLKAFESAPSMIFVGSNYSGHEEITRQALNSISKRIKDSDTYSIFQLSDLTFDLSPEPRGLFGYKSKNMVIHGNFASDFPKQTTVLSLAEFWKDKRLSQFENPNAQVLHFLRNYKNSLTLASAKETCLLAREKIKHITLQALNHWESGRTTEALFLIGHATHTIQDSFSRAHTVREESGNYNLKNICFFGTDMSKKIDTTFEKDPEKQVCYHSAPDSRDAIWNYKSKQARLSTREWANELSIDCDSHENYPESEDKKQSCLSHEARLARTATEKYLLLVFNHLNPAAIVKNKADAFVNVLDARLFDGPVGDSDLDQKMANGIIRCDDLSAKEIVGTEPRDNYMQKHE